MSMTAKDFGRKLLETGDLDPIYIMLRRAKDSGMPAKELHQWLVAYWLFYHAGVATQLAVEKNFWDMATAHAVIPAGKRGTERRHFRALNATKALAVLRDRFPNPSEMVTWMREGGSYAPIVKEVKSWPQFGPWIAFKVADMAERVMGYKVDFKDCELDIFSEPLKGGSFVAYSNTNPGISLEAMKECYEGADKSVRLANLQIALNYLQKTFGKIDAPNGGRKCGVQEFETILCKYKSHLNGHYEPGKDIIEIGHNLDGYGPRAAKLKTLLPVWK